MKESKIIFIFIALVLVAVLFELFSVLTKRHFPNYSSNFLSNGVVVLDGAQILGNAISGDGYQVVDYLVKKRYSPKEAIELLSAGVKSMGFSCADTDCDRIQSKRSWWVSHWVNIDGSHIYYSLKSDQMLSSTTISSNIKIKIRYYSQKAWELEQRARRRFNQ